MKKGCKMKKVKLITAMAKKGMNQIDLAKKVKVNRATISQLVNDKSDGSVDLWRKIAKELDVEIGDIIE